jgi:hypothetical protein
VLSAGGRPDPGVVRADLRAVFAEGGSDGVFGQGVLLGYFLVVSAGSQHVPDPTGALKASLQPHCAGRVAAPPAKVDYG